MPEDAFPEEESFRCQLGREKGLRNAEVHQTSGICMWIRNMHGALTGKSSLITCQWVFGTQNGSWHCVGMNARLTGEQGTTKYGRKIHLAMTASCDRTRPRSLGGHLSHSAVSNGANLPLLCNGYPQVSKWDHLHSYTQSASLFLRLRQGISFPLLFVVSSMKKVL